MNNFLWLEQWHQQQLNGIWEQSPGISITSTDAPGWQVRIALQFTSFDHLPNAELKRMQQSATEWMTCSLVAGTFNAAGGPLMLGPILQVFRNLIESHAHDR